MQRRQFFTTAMAGALTAESLPVPLTSSAFGEAVSPRKCTRLGLDTYSMRGMRQHGWKAKELIKFAAEQKLDAVLFNGLFNFDSLEPSHLKKLKALADRSELKLYSGAGKIAENGKRFNGKWGTAEELVALGIKIAQALGSPVVNVRIGNLEDRLLEGGIQPRIDEAVRVLKASASRARDAGIRFGVENHAADLRSEELVMLVEEVGTDICGVMLDPGNGLWAMEDPMKQLNMLAPYTVCNSIRDYMVWPSDDGAMCQWVAVGEGMMDVPKYVDTLAGANPGMPIFVETISNSTHRIPFLTQEHWDAFPNLKGSQITDFLALVRKGKPTKIDKPAAGQDRKAFEQEHQRAEFLTSIAYLREHCGAVRE